MSATAAKRERQPRHLQPVEPPSLAELAATANREHALCEQAMRTALPHAIAAGLALIGARERVSDGQWLSWLTTNFTGSSSSARNYIRLATYQERLQLDMRVQDAIDALAGLPAAAPAQVNGPFPADVRNAAVAAVRSGERMRDVAERVGTSVTTIHAWANPGKRALYKSRERAKRKAAREALAKQSRDEAIRRAVRKAGAALAEAYSSSQRFAGVLAQARDEAKTDEARAALEEATAHYHKMNDCLIRALGVET